MMTRAVIIFKNACLILEWQKSEGPLSGDFLSIMKPSEITKIIIEFDVVVGLDWLPRLAWCSFGEDFAFASPLD